MTFGRHWVTAAVVPLILGACSGEAEPRFEAPPTETPSAVESTPAAEPQPWERKTTKGAVAFAEHWMAVFSTAINSGESAGLRKLITPSCEACSAIVERIDSIERDGGFYRSPEGWKILDAVAQKTGAPNEVIVALRVRQGAEEFRETVDSKVVRTPPTRESLSVTFAWSDSRWAMTDLEVLT